MNCEICSKELSGKQREYCSVECKTKAKILRQKERKVGELYRAINERGGVCEHCGHNVLRSLFFYHPVLTGTTICNLLQRTIGAETLAVLGACKLICRNCYWERYYG